MKAVFLLFLFFSQLTFAQSIKEKFEGKPSPEFFYRTSDNTFIDNLNRKNRTTLLIFWSFDCSTCLARVNELRQNAKGWQGKPFDLVIVSTDQTAEPLKTYLQFLNVNTPKRVNESLHFIWRKDSNNRDKFDKLPNEAEKNSLGVNSFIIAPDGKIKFALRGLPNGDQWDAIADLLP